MIDESVVNLAMEARRELGIRSSETISATNMESTSYPRPRSAAPKTTRKRSCMRTGEREVKQGSNLGLLLTIFKNKL